MFFNFSKSSNDKIFASYYKRYEANYEASEVNTRGTADVNNVSKLINAVQLYDQGKFIPAIGQFEEILKTDAGNMAAHFFAGIALIEIRDYDKAIENLLFVISKKDMAYIEHSEWYLALCYLKKNETSKAVTMLKTIADNNSYYKTRALELLKQLQ
jgi:tetratricopeptide (TPR) repeat protein